MGEETTTQTETAGSKTTPATKTETPKKPTPRRRTRKEPAKPKPAAEVKTKPQAEQTRKRRTKADLDGGEKTTLATQTETDTPVTPEQFDVVGEDGRRLARSWSRDACRELVQRVNAQSDEKLKIVSASPFTSIQADTGL